MPKAATDHMSDTARQILISKGIIPSPGHLGPTLFMDNLDYFGGNVIKDPSNDHTVAEVINLDAVGGWIGGSQMELGFSGSGITPTSGFHWLDTQNSAGPINISHVFTDTTTAAPGGYTGPPGVPSPALPAGTVTTSVLSFDIGKESLDFNGQHYETDPNASFEFRIDNTTVATFHASDFATANEFKHFDINLNYSFFAGGVHTLTLVDTTATAGYAGFAIDTVQIHDWII
ncbi:hypothetical protein Q3C01_32630 [Bradyrhizobium sp. UFLA05-109]